mmetsp:Transcript_3403/g.6440  ORF Transcript_3403/g.6440 Transcript_3403/m.6440 type:complete len:291 (+) Transcript_3403:47-919(+)|eukprot:CAMPEP_0175140976 /NCGR_PEP_ID=MMETSP0087-20121206/11822_1 /TAXON_ID=136419 /ORGANISM="Unknown Unknown, Strain D1" /LENGTH=290 /DNA_ID=CAMNT_0016424287 /DNA_START=56 /DNA_END=928 /DNA_ORIENTATION=-
MFGASRRRYQTAPSSEIIGDNDTHNRSPNDVFFQKSSPQQQRDGLQAEDDLTKGSTSLLDKKFQVLSIVEASQPEGVLKEQHEHAKQLSAPSRETIGEMDETVSRSNAPQVSLEHITRDQNFSDRLNYVYSCLSQVQVDTSPASRRLPPQQYHEQQSPNEELAYAVQAKKFGDNSARENYILQTNRPTFRKQTSSQRSGPKEELVSLEDTVDSTTPRRGGGLDDQLNTNTGDYVDMRQFKHRVNYVYEVLKAVEKTSTPSQRYHHSESPDEEDVYDIASKPSRRSPRARL